MQKLFSNQIEHDKVWVEIGTNVEFMKNKKDKKSSIYPLHCGTFCYNLRTKSKKTHKIGYQSMKKIRD